jgi:hypothetical protein
MPIDLGAVSAGLLSTSILIPADGSPTEDYNLNGIKLFAGQTYLFQSPDGVPATLNLSGFQFDAAATSGNPVVVQVQGADVTLIVPASVPARVTAGDVVIEAISPFWTPREMTATKFYGLYAGDSSTYDASGNGSYLDWFGGSVVASKQDAGAAVYNAASGVVEVRAGTSALLLDSSFSGDTYVFLSIAQLIGQRADQGIDGSSSSSARYLRLNTLDGGSASQTRSPDGGKAHWNGILDGAGDLIENNIDNAYWPHPNASGASSNKMPLGPFFGIILRNFGSSARNLLFRYGDPNTALSGDVRAYLVFTSTPTTDEILKLQGWAAWDLINAFGGDIDADYLLSSNHPYYSGPPLLTGGGSSSVTVVAPTVTVTLTELITGTEVRIFNTGTSAQIAGSEAITGTTFAFSPSAAFDIEVFKRGYKILKLRNIAVPSSDQEIQVAQLIDRGFFDEA